MTRAALAVATAELAARDPAIGALVSTHGAVRFGPRPPVDGRFEALAVAIVSQQLAGAAAVTIWGRVRSTVGEPFTAARLLAVDDAGLRAAGLSNAKTAAMRDLATRVADRRLDVRALGRLDDESVIRELSAVRGIGRWTAEMFCIFALHRLDVWPIGDLGVRQGFAITYGAAVAPGIEELATAGERYRPYRSVAAWYFWRAADAARRAARASAATRAGTATRANKTQRDPE